MMTRIFALFVFATVWVVGSSAEAVPEAETVDEAAQRTRALQRSLFKTGGAPLVEPRAEEPLRPVRLQPPAPRLAIVLPRPVMIPAVRELALQPASYTPYDRYLGSVRRVIAELDARDADMLLACDLMREGRRFRYVVNDPYRADPPARTAARRAGDCKAKALWLYDRLGDPTALYVIGKLQRGARSSHAWVYWRSQGRWWILDPTDRTAPVAADSVAPNRYVPYYSFGKSGTYRHPATRLLVETAPSRDPVPAVAGQSVKASAAAAPRKDKRLAKR